MLKFTPIFEYTPLLAKITGFLFNYPTRLYRPASNATVGGKHAVPTPLRSQEEAKETEST
jgi:hypothetical protein